MYKVFLTVRNRLEITKMCIESLKKHSSMPYDLYVYDNASNYMVKDHFKYFGDLYEKGEVAQVTFTTPKSTFNAFSKASACNFFGKQHEEDPNKDNYDFLLFIDNDIILTPEFDKKLKVSWHYIKKNKLDHIKVIGQIPGGIKNREQTLKFAGMMGRVGRLGGSGLWSVRPNFFTDVGYLNLKALVGQDKKHDQMYWVLLGKAAGGKPYIMGINQKLGIHCGKIAGSVCNRLTRTRDKNEKIEAIKFKEKEEKIAKYKFDEFYKMILDDRSLVKDW